MGNIALFVLGLTSGPAFAGGIACPAGMTALDVEFAVDRAAAKPFTFGNETISLDPNGFVFLNLPTSRGGATSPVDAGGEYRGCVKTDANGETFVSLEADILLDGRASHEPRIWSMTVSPANGTATVISNWHVESLNWDVRNALTLHPFPGATVTIRTVSK